jgi:arylsulfatase
MVMLSHALRAASCAPVALSCLLVLTACGERVAGRNPASGDAASGAVLPFPPVPSASVAGPTLQTSKHQRRPEPRHLMDSAPNILIVLLDDAGFGLPDTYGGPVHTPSLSRVAAKGISYNTFHTTSICSPTRAALLTGRNHHRVGNGTIAERALDWDGYSGVIPRSSATIPKVLGAYGYRTAAFGKWHNTPTTETTPMGPFTNWPTGEGIGFDYFYGFLAGETSQWEPRLFENLNPVEPPRNGRYHLSEDLADRAISWLRRHRAFAPDKPFFMYWASGASHGPHHVAGAWADRYKGKFDEGWDVLREQTFARQRAMGWIPSTAKLTPRDPRMVGWDSIPESERPFQRRLMEVFAGFTEHGDTQVGRLLDELDRQGVAENTLVIYIFGDNGSSSEGQGGTVSELLAQNNMPSSIAQHLAALEEAGGLSALGGPEFDNMYHAGWAWAGGTPLKGTKLVAGDFGGTRNPMAISWPRRIKHDTIPRSQFHHVNDIAPTIYELLSIRPPSDVDGFQQDPIDGVSLAYTFGEPGAPGRKRTQYFENNGSRGIYHEGWYASTFGPMVPWNTAASTAALKDWDADRDVWELYDTRTDFSQSHDLAAKEPAKLAEMKALFLTEAGANKVFPVGGALWTRLHPEDRIKSPYTNWEFDANTRRMPEFTAPGLGRQSTLVTIDADVGRDASGVLYALGGASGGVALYMDRGTLAYEYNAMIIDRFSARSSAKLAPGRHVIEVETHIAKPGAPADVALRVDGKEVGRAKVGRTVPAAFTASETFDVGIDLGAPVAHAYSSRAPFPFTGTITSVKVAER